MRSSNLNNSAILLRKIYFAGFCLLAFVLFFYQIIKGDYYFERAKNNYVRLIPSRAIRGSIFDRGGKALAYDKATFNISVIPYQIKNKKTKIFSDLSQFLNYDPVLLYKNYKKNLQSPFSPVNIIEDIDKAQALKIKEQFENLILINSQPRRFYPKPASFSHTLGYVKEAAAHYEKLKKYGYSPLERVGFLGIEQYYDTYLRGQDGADSIEINATGEIVGFLGKQMPTKGKDIFLTIDSRIQEIARESIQKTKGTIILMESNSGEIISIYSNPSFDLNHFIEGKNIDQYLKSKKSPLLNRVHQATYPMGSTLKPILAIAALDEAKITPNKTFMCTGKFKLGIATFRCMHTHGRQNLSQALINSCNIYFYNVGLALGPNLISEWAKKFGLSSLTGIDLPYEKKGLVPSPKWKQKTKKQNWFPGDTLNLSIGQGFLNVTPLEALVAMNVFASDGYLITPYILKKVAQQPSSPPSRTYLGINSRNLETVKISLRSVVGHENGTGRLLNRLNLNISGKTGTAQNRRSPHGWFVGYFPYKDTKYTICIFLENVGSSYEALRVAYKFLKKITEEDLL